MYRYNLTKIDTFGSFFDIWLVNLKMHYLIIKMLWKKNFKAIYYLRKTGFLMIPNICTVNFIFTYFYWNVYKFLNFWGTSKIHEMDHIGSKTRKQQLFSICYPNILSLLYEYNSDVHFPLSGWIDMSTWSTWIYTSKFCIYEKWSNIVFISEIPCAYRFSGSIRMFEMISWL